MTITSYDDLIAADAANYGLSDCFYMQQSAVGTSIASGQNEGLGIYQANMPLLPSLPGGKTYYAPTVFQIASSVIRPFILARVTLLGSLDLSTPTFTDGSAAPTITEGGVSRQVPSSILGVVSTAFNATPGNFTITYVDQDVNTAETTTSTALTASAPVGTAGFIELNSPDWGATDITSATRTGGTTPTGVLDFYHVWPLCQTMASVAGNVMGAVNFLTDRAHLFKLSASDKLAIIYPLTTAGAVQGKIKYIAL